MEEKNEMIGIVVFAKAIISGISKTRIASLHGIDTADSIYRELLKVTSNLVSQFCYHVAFTGDSEPIGLREYFDGAMSFFPQAGETLGERLYNASKHMFQMGCSGVIAIGCDCPYMHVDDLKRAIDVLGRGYHVAIGPANDGGYYLIGTKPAALCLFNVKSWSQPTLFEDTMHLFKEGKFSYIVLPHRSDIDTMEDFIAWQNYQNNQ